MLGEVKWEKYGVVDGVARDARCENCMVHCGYDPSGALSSNPTDNWKNMTYNFSPKPAPYYEGRNVKAFNGFSIGKGHLAEAKAAINPARGHERRPIRFPTPRRTARARRGRRKCGTATQRSGTNCWPKLRRTRKPRSLPS